MEKKKDFPIPEFEKDKSCNLIMPRATFGEWLSYKIANLQAWWRYHHYIKPLYAAGNKLIKLNPDVMPDTFNVRTWTRLWLPLVCEIRFMRLDESVTVGAGQVTKNGDMADVQSSDCVWLWLYRNYERYVIIPKGMDKEKS